MRRFSFSLVLVIACGDDLDSAASSGDGDGSTTEAADTSVGTSVDFESDESGTTTSDETPVSGIELFLGMCAPCHGAEGEGGPLAYELQHPNRAHATWVVRNGRPGLEFPGSQMAAYSPEVVSDEQLEEIFDYLDSFPQPTTGEALYLDYCGNCHGADPRTGGAVDKDPLDDGPDEILEQVREGDGGTDYGNRGEYMPAFSADRLSDAEVQAIIDWLVSL